MHSTISTRQHHMFLCFSPFTSSCLLLSNGVPHHHFQSSASAPVTVVKDLSTRSMFSFCYDMLDAHLFFLLLCSECICIYPLPFALCCQPRASLPCLPLYLPLSHTRLASFLVAFDIVFLTTRSGLSPRIISFPYLSIVHLPFLFRSK